MNDAARETYLLTSDAARLLDVTPAAVRAATQRGRIRPVAVTERGVHLYARDEIKRYARERSNRRAVA